MILLNTGNVLFFIIFFFTEEDLKFLDPVVRVASVLETARFLCSVLDELIDAFPSWEQEHLSKRETNNKDEMEITPLLLKKHIKL